MRTFLLVVSAWLACGVVHAQEFISLESYKCRNFLADSASPDQVDKFILSLLTVAWGTGYAAAHQRDRIRADVVAMRSIAVILGEACRKDPDKVAVQAVAEAVRKLVEEVK